jgi:SsrA-binding protein
MITVNKKVKFEYFIEDNFEAGMVLQGWEVKAIREGKVNINECYITPLKGELFVIGMHVIPLSTSGTHQVCDPTRTRKLLLNKKEVDGIIGKASIDGYTIVPLDLHYSNGKVKMTIGVAKGKNNRDKRDTVKERDWNREKARILKSKK